jgi:hypothetical protein
MALLRCEIYLKDMQARRAQYGVSPRDAEAVAHAAGEALTLSQALKDDTLLGRSYFWSGVAAFYDNNLGQSTRFFNKAKRCEGWITRGKERGWIEHWLRSNKKGLGPSTRKRDYARPRHCDYPDPEVSGAPMESNNSNAGLFGYIKGLLF